MPVTVTITQTQTVQSKPKKPDLYEVFLLNDDYTPMEFVIEVLKQFFAKNEEAAQTIMLKIHTEGEGVCGIYPYDIAKIKAEQVMNFSHANKQPLKCEIRILKV